jgi:hypothetical protein
MRSLSEIDVGYRCGMDDRKATLFGPTLVKEDANYQKEKESKLN